MAVIKRKPLRKDSAKPVIEFKVIPNKEDFNQTQKEALQKILEILPVVDRALQVHKQSYPPNKDIWDSEQLLLEHARNQGINIDALVMLLYNAFFKEL